MNYVSNSPNSAKVMIVAKDNTVTEFVTRVKDALVPVDPNSHEFGYCSFQLKILLPALRGTPNVKMALALLLGRDDLNRLTYKAILVNRTKAIDRRDLFKSNNHESPPLPVTSLETRIPLERGWWTGRAGVGVDPES